MHETEGSFTIPGEAGYEDLTLSLAKTWGADCVRDCDGTKLSEQILNSGMQVYSTICIIREHNDFAALHPGCQQQVFLESKRMLCTSNQVHLPLMEGYFTGQFQVDDTPQSLRYWQVFDRTSQKEVPLSCWEYDAATQTVAVTGACAFHEYSANFLAWRVWEEINMYNHVTNAWDKEPLRQLDPRDPVVQAYLLNWLEDWCESHPETSIVRFTSLFYNFVWIWGSDERNRHLFTDWSSYDFTVSPLALDRFASQYGYALCSEDFINKGLRNPSHIVWDRKMKDYLDFTNQFVVSYAKDLVAMVHRFGKKAYVFYDDSWVGMEPYGHRFASIGFDGIIKCVFSAFETRMCAAVLGPAVHEIRLHPYLFPVGLGGSPTFAEGGDPALDAQKYWVEIRRALLRSSVQRIGLGGYLHLTEGFPQFVQTMTTIADEFRLIKALHEDDVPWVYRPRIAILSGWGKLRSWTCGGHYHEHPDLDLLNILESLAGLPFEVSFLGFDDVSLQALDAVDVVINAGFAASSWSGGSAWASDSLVQMLNQWVWEGGTFLAVNEASAVPGCDTGLRMAPALGVLLDDGKRLCHGKWPMSEGIQYAALFGNATMQGKSNILLLDSETEVIKADGGLISAATRTFGEGRGVYLSQFRHSPANSKMLQRLLVWCTKEEESVELTCDVDEVSLSYFEKTKRLVLSNASDQEELVHCNTPLGPVVEKVAAFGMKVRDLV